jgi:alkylation response protein AidB-like acyl-CoA dehydrogenase
VDFEIGHEHALLRESVRRALESAKSASEAWTRCVDVGLAGLDCRDGCAPADDLVSMMVAQEEIGRALVALPFVDTVVQAGALLRATGHDALPAIESGAMTVSVAHGAQRPRYARDDAPLHATAHGRIWRIEGTRPMVAFADSAGAIVVPARTGDGALTLFLVTPDVPGLTCTRVQRLDGQPACDLRFDSVVVDDTSRVGPVGGGAPLLEGARRMAIVALVAEAVGCMDALLALTVDYLRTRQQFGRPLGSFQALQHRAADMYVAVEQARSMMLFCTLSAREPDVDTRARAVAAAKVQAGRSARFVGQSAVQLHGGIGVADECRAGHCFKRLTAIELALGDADDHLAFLGERGGLFAPGVA